MYCQNCRTPLNLDGSLNPLNPTAFELLVNSTDKNASGKEATQSGDQLPNPPDRREKYDRSESQSTQPYYRRSLQGPRTGGHQPPGLPRGDSSMSFVMLTESQFGPPPVESPSPNLPNRKNSQLRDPNHDDGSPSYLEQAIRLFEIVSARSDIDHPICVECTDMLVDGLQKRLNASTKERDAYIAFLRTLNSSVPSNEDIEAAEKSLKETLSAEEAAFAELQALEREKASLDEEIAGLEEESQQLDADEQSFWRARNGFSLKLAKFQTERQTVNMRYDHDSQQLKRLQKTNVYNDAFCIGHDGHFGTINGLRLGRLANHTVEWPEINAAWGQVCLLLATIADQLNFQFQGYRLRPLGSTSRIDKIEVPVQTAGMAASKRDPKVTKLDLFLSNEFPLNFPLLLHRRLDSGMVAFLECLRQLGDFVEATPVQRRGQTETAAPRLRLPYEIKDDRIGDASIKLGFSQNDETWTRACKYTLTCCKYLLAHASNVANTDSHSAAVAAAAVAAADSVAQKPSTATPAKTRP